MPNPSMSGPEIGGRLFALEAVTIALAAEITAAMPDDKAKAMIDSIRPIAAEMLKDVLPGGALSPIGKQISDHCAEYADTFADMIAKERAKLVAQKEG